MKLRHDLTLKYCSLKEVEGLTQFPGTICSNSDV